MQTEDGQYSRIKDIHIEVCLGHNVESDRTTGLESVQLQPGFPTFSIPEMDLTVPFVGKTLSLPLFIAPITGGGKQSARINRNLAEAAERMGIGMALGSQRPMLEKKTSRESYMVRNVAPTIPLLANLGLVHVRKGKDYLLEAIESVRADGITLYVNPLHEILQEDGEKDFREVLDVLGAIVADFPYPVFLKEVGTGFPESLVSWACSRRIAGIDVAGVGGTNWARIEGLIRGRDYSLYESLGRCTREGIISARRLLTGGQYVIASGGIRTGVHVAQTIALGADLTAMALPFLRWADQSAEAVVSGIQRLRDELSITMWYCGARTIADLKSNLSAS